MFAVFHFYFCWYFHAMVADKVIDHLQFVEEGFFVKRFTSEIKTDCIKDFLVFKPGKVGPAFSAFYAYFLRNDTAFTTRPKPVKDANTTAGFKVISPSSYHSFACHKIAKQVFFL